MNRLYLVGLITLGLTIVAVFGGAAGAEGNVKSCAENSWVCTEVVDSIGYAGEYTGHDEPSLLFYSNTAGAGNSNLYNLTLPQDPPQQPLQDGSGATWNFQLHPAFWFGMAMCDTQSAPEFQHSSCTPDSDTNIFDNPDPTAPDYIGHHPGTAFMEMQFYPPGWAPWEAGVSCDATKWCAALTIDSLSISYVDGTTQNHDCLNHAGPEPVSFAFITLNGKPQASPDPTKVFNAPYAATTVDPTKDLLMGSGDNLTVDMHDTAAGFQVVIHDVTSGQTGSMTASVDNGFQQVLYEPKSSSCHTAPYAYHPMYSTSGEHTRVPWAAHSYNVAFSDEIGHFEYCAKVVGYGCGGGNANDPAGSDGDEAPCFRPSESLLVQVGGCIGTDFDFDGPSYQPGAWPGTNSTTPTSTPIVFKSPLFNGTANYSRVAFETDLPRIEAPDSGGICNRTTGANCVNPPPGANFYPIFTTGTQAAACVWRFGGPSLPGTTNTFGGNSTAEYGPLLQLFYPQPAPVNFVARYNNFRNILSSNPCPA
jgi:hypothetical protein